MRENLEYWRDAQIQFKRPGGKVVYQVVSVGSITVGGIYIVGANCRSSEGSTTFISYNKIRKMIVTGG